MGPHPILLWYHSSSFEELCCTLCLPCFLYLYNFYYTYFPFRKMAEERTARSTTTEPSTNSYLYLHPGENLTASLVLDSTN